MNCILSRATLMDKTDKLKSFTADVFVKDGIIADIAPSLPRFPGAEIIDLDDCFLFPGLVDVHVHLREPGFSYKETIASGTASAVRGGFSSLCAMPNLSPPPDTLKHLNAELNIIRRDALAHVYPYGTITRGQAGVELSDMDGLAPYVVAFSDDGHGVQSDAVMEAAMKKAKSLGKIIAAHCEYISLIKGGHVYDGQYAKRHGLTGISSESEWRQIARDLELVRATGCSYHVCHVSTKEGVALIRRAKADGLDVTSETAPHYLLLSDEDLTDDGRFKMNPPIRSRADREALVEAVCDGTIDIVATDHAPHSAEEKSKGLWGSLMGVVGLETAFPVLYTSLVKTGIMPLSRLIELMHDAPGRRFKIGSKLKVGQRADLTAFRLGESFVTDSAAFLSKGRSTPFEGRVTYGICRFTMVNGRIVYNAKTV